LGIAAGFFGAFTLVFLIYSRIFPTLPVPVAEQARASARARDARVSA